MMIMVIYYALISSDVIGDKVMWRNKAKGLSNFIIINSESSTDK